jgi:site-specific DNA-methyltransferase (adenine-specific)
MELYNVDCLIGMKNIKDKSIDLILADLPFGSTQNHWDKVIDLSELFNQYNRIIKDNGAILLFSQQPFCVDLIIANRKYFRYEWIWEKEQGTGFLNAKKCPLKSHENILVFYKKLPTYNPQMEEGKPYEAKKRNHHSGYGKYDLVETINDGTRYPKTILRFNREKGLHQTQKPVDLLEYLIKTYTNENEIVLDNTMGSGSTGIACINTDRYFIGMEMDNEIFQIAKNRIEKHKKA